MKKKIIMATSFILAAAMLTACGAGGNATAGYSAYTYTTSSKSATADAGGSVEVNSYIAYSGVDGSGKIFKAGIDAIQTKIGFDAAGQLTADTTTITKTKNELGDEYGMRKASPIGKEWNEQAQAFADWSVGKKLADVKNAKVVDKDGKQVFDDADLVSSVTVTATNFQKPLAASDTHKLKGNVSTSDKLGMGTYTKISSSKSATEEAAGVGQVDSAIAVVSLDSAGKITGCFIDSIQTKVNFDTTGNITTELQTDVKSKTELGADYGMTKASAIGKEWYEQAAAFAEYCVGKTLDEVKSMATKKVDDNHPMVPDVPELASSVTITVNDYIAALEKAVANAK